MTVFFKRSASGSLSRFIAFAATFRVDLVGLVESSTGSRVFCVRAMSGSDMRERFICLQLLIEVGLALGQVARGSL